MEREIVRPNALVREMPLKKKSFQLPFLGWHWSEKFCGVIQVSISLRCLVLTRHLGRWAPLDCSHHFSQGKGLDNLLQIRCPGNIQWRRSAKSECWSFNSFIFTKPFAQDLSLCLVSCFVPPPLLPLCFL